MHNNDTLSLLRQALTLDDQRLVATFALGGLELTAEQARAYATEPGAEGAENCLDASLMAFLDGLIIDQRGPRDPSLPAPRRAARLTNNGVLKKLRIALTLQEADLLQIFEAGGKPMTNRELTTLFRKPKNKHFRRCSDEVLAAFFTGLRARGAVLASPSLEDGS